MKKSIKSLKKLKTKIFGSDEINWIKLNEIVDSDIEKEVKGKYNKQDNQIESRGDIELIK